MLWFNENCRRYSEQHDRHHQHRHHHLRPPAPSNHLPLVYSAPHLPHELDDQLDLPRQLERSVA